MDYTKRDFDTKRHHKKHDGFPLIGVILISLGFVFLLDRLHLIPPFMRNMLISWQMLLIFIGTVNLFRPSARFSGLILILIGSAFLLPHIVHIPFETRRLIWPVLLILIGSFIVFKAKNFKNPRFFASDNRTVNSSDRLEEVAILGGGKRVITSQNLKGGNITTIFGGLDIDLTEADFEGDIMVIEIAAIFGGASITVKSEWDVRVQVTSILGGFSDDRRVFKGNDNHPTKRLVIKGVAIFGGGEVKTY